MLMNIAKTIVETNSHIDMSDTELDNIITHAQLPLKRFTTRLQKLNKVYGLAKQMVDRENNETVEAEERKREAAKKVGRGLVLNIDGVLVAWSKSKTSQYTNAKEITIVSGTISENQLNWIKEHSNAVLK